MANKLTKEQCDYVLEQFNNTQRMKNTRNCGYLGIDNFDIADVHKIINQCTEKEFPRFTVVDRYNKDISADFAPVYQHILFSKIDLEVGEEWILSVEQFKQFTAGAIKICEWIEENEQD